MFTALFLCVMFMVRQILETLYSKVAAVNLSYLVNMN